MIRIAGLGASGSYLYRRLVDSGFDVEGYDPKRSGFYIPCGYAVNMNRLSAFLKKIEIDAENYLEASSNHVIFESDSGININLPTSGFSTIDKNRLESDILGDLKVERRSVPLTKRDKDILIDATGVSRYYLGPATGDLLMRTKEYLTEVSPHEDFYFRYFPSGRGYYWEFPLKQGYHIGAGGDSIDLVTEALDNVKGHLKVMSRNIRLSPLFDQIHRGNIIGIGEAIGTVSPITGEGILPSIESAEILFQQLKKYNDIQSLKERYSYEIKKTFSRYIKLFELLMDTRNGKLKKVRNLSAISAAREDFENFGIELKISKVLKQLAFR